MFDAYMLETLKRQKTATAYALLYTEHKMGQSLPAARMCPLKVAAWQAENLPPAEDRFAKPLTFAVISQ
ncbi:hypothetical protein [Halioxenophilus aromaticivorans]|uniref:Uncharacterized protein n=1 Tax=Halioxenophilus aromaticivorans TaxID=1306992 RepID=A0AAV3TZV2_9ALTE